MKSRRKMRKNRKSTTMRATRRMQKRKTSLTTTVTTETSTLKAEWKSQDEDDSGNEAGRGGVVSAVGPCRRTAARAAVETVLPEWTHSSQGQRKMSLSSQPRAHVWCSQENDTFARIDGRAPSSV